MNHDIFALTRHIPVSNTATFRWEAADQAALKRAVAKIETHGANPWVFAADARHFWQFAEAADVACLTALDSAEHDALLGPWSDEDWVSA